MAANIWIIPDLKIWQFSCTATTSFIILYHEQPTFGWFSCKNHSRFKVDNFPGWLWVMIFVWQISCMAVNFFWQISGMAVRSEIRLTIFLFFVLKLVDNFTIWQNYRNPQDVQVCTHNFGLWFFVGFPKGLEFLKSDIIWLSWTITHF